jgi:hypothetical protein
MAVDIGREAELARQQDRATLQVVQQRGRTVAAVIGFAGERLPAAVAAAVVEGGFLQDVPIVGQQLLLTDADMVIAMHDSFHFVCAIPS